MNKGKRWLAKVLSTEWSPDFIQKMQDRMVVSFCKYGPVRDGFPKKINSIDSLQQRLQKYKDTGNLEFIVDAANFCLIEFLCPSHPQAFFRGTDSDESPGRTTNTGRITQEGNEDSQSKAFKARQKEGD